MSDASTIFEGDEPDAHLMLRIFTTVMQAEGGMTTASRKIALREAPIIVQLATNLWQYFDPIHQWEKPHSWAPASREAVAHVRRATRSVNVATFTWAVPVLGIPLRLIKYDSRSFPAQVSGFELASDRWSVVWLFAQHSDGTLKLNDARGSLHCMASRNIDRFESDVAQVALGIP